MARLCARHDCQFQAIDLRWGVSEEASFDQQTMNICFRELDRCREVTRRPNFVILLGDRYGWIPLPPQIEAAEFEAVRSASGAAELIDDWYHRDENVIPAIYRLRARRMDVPKESDLSRWRETEESLRTALLRGIESLGWLPEDPRRVKYQCSATHQEILRGALGAPNDQNGIFAFFRNIIDRSKLGPHSPFIDQGSGQVDALKKSLSESPGVRTFAYSVPSDDMTANLRRLRVDAFRSIGRVIREEIRRFKTINPLDGENKAHAEFGEEHSRCFAGRTKPLQAVAHYVCGDAPNPLVLYGPSGSGKTALIARAADDAVKNHPQVLVIRRFIGATPESTDVRLLLDNVRRQVMRLYGAPPELFDEHWDVKSALRACLTLATPERPLILFVDALDQLTPLRPSALDWLPRELPPYTKVVISVMESEGESGEALRSIRDRLPQRALLRLEEMLPEEAELVLDGWLAESGRKLTTEQRSVIMEGFGRCPTPLYLRLAFEEGRRWSSSDRPQTLAADVEGMVSRLVECWQDERQHGRALVNAFLGLLASSRYGLSEVEIIDLLSSDEAVLRGLSKYSTRPLPSNHLPTAVWVRLYQDVAPYLVSRMGEGAPLMNFYHRLVAEVIAATQKRRERHDHLARYFRKAADPRGDGSWTGGSTHSLQELPFQLAQIDPHAYLGLLTDFAWLQAKVDRGLYEEAIADAKLGADQSADERSTRIFRLLSKTLQMARATGRDPRQLAGQIVGRLFGNIESEVARLVDSTRAWRDGYWLCPVGPALRSPGAAVEETLMGSGHGGKMLVAALEDPDKFVTSADEGLLAIWSLREQREIEVLEAHTAPISLLCASPSGRYLLSVSKDGRIRLWKTRKTGLEPAADWTEPLERVEEDTLSDLSGERPLIVAACFSADDSNFALAGTDQVIRVRKVDDLARVKLLGAYREKHAGITSISASADCQFLASGSADKTITVYDVARGTIHAKLAGHREAVKSVCLSADGARLLSTGDRTARVWDIASGDHSVVCEDLLQGVKLGTWTHDAGSYVLADSLNGVLVLDAPDGAVRERFEVPGFPITSATLSVDRACVIACGFDQQITILRLGTSTTASLDVGAKLAKNIAISPSADAAAVVVSNPMGMQQMFLVDLATGREHFSTTPWAPGEGVLALLDGGWRIASVHGCGRTRNDMSGALKQWHWSRDNSIYTVCSASSLGGRWLAYLRSDGKVGLWDSQQEEVEEVATNVLRPGDRVFSQGVPDSEQELRRFARAIRKSAGLAVNASGDCVANIHPLPASAATEDEDAELPKDVVTLWRRSQRRLLGSPEWESETFRLEGYEIQRIAVSDDGDTVLACFSSGLVGFFHCREKQLMIIGSHSAEVVCAFFASDPLRAFTASADRTIKVWDGEDGNLLAEFQADWPIMACSASSGFLRIVAFDSGGTLINLRLVTPADPSEAMVFQVAENVGPRVSRLVTRTLDEVRVGNLKGIQAETSGAVREACAWYRASFCGANRLLGYTHPWTRGALRNLSDALLRVAPLEKTRKVESAARRIGSAERRRARTKREDVRRNFKEMSIEVAHQMLEVLQTVGQEAEVDFGVTADASMRARVKIAPERLQQGIEWVTDFPRELIGPGPLALAAILRLMGEVISIAKAVLLYDFLEDIVLPFGASPKSTMRALKAVGNALGRDLVCVKFDSGVWYGLSQIAPPFIVHLVQEQFAAVTGYRDGVVEWSESGVSKRTSELEFATMLDTFVLAPASSLPTPELWKKVPDPLAAFVWG